MERLPRLSLDLLRGFRSAARHLSFTRAADELFVTQSAISQEIRKLEEQIGQPLFHRVHRTLQLTRAGEALFRAADEALKRIDETVQSLAGSCRTVTMTTTTALASLWLAPRLARFNRLYPDIDVMVVTSNDTPDLERDQIDVAIRFVTTGADAPDAEPLMICESFPVCAPSLMRDPARPLRVPADLVHHVQLDYETVRDGKRLSEWDFWNATMNLRPITPASTLRFPQFDQWVPAAIDGAGVAIGVLPHLMQHLHDGVLCAPFGFDAIARRGAFFIVRRRDAAASDAVDGFIEWLRSEVARDRELALVPNRS